MVIVFIRVGSISMDDLFNVLLDTVEVRYIKELDECAVQALQRSPSLQTTHLTYDFEAPINSHKMRQMIHAFHYTLKSICVSSKLYFYDRNITIRDGTYRTEIVLYNIDKPA